MENFNVCGIVCEYNPFHKGHLYQISEAKKRSGAEFIIAVMSGNFVQRGEPAIINKWARTQMAIMGGADIVIELPTPFAIASAEFFAYGSMNVLKSTGVVTHVSFGSESFEGETGSRKIKEAAAKDVLVDKEILKKGMSYAAATRNEIDILPNDLLGIEYARAARKMDFTPKFIPVKRTGSNHDKQGSAKYIRTDVILEGIKNDAVDYSLLNTLMPDFAVKILLDEIKDGRGPVFVENIEKIILADLRRKTPRNIQKCPFVSEGIEYKILSETLRKSDFREIVDACTSKRYTSSRIRRIMLSAVLEINKELIKKEVPYIRILGMNKNAGKLMTAIKEKTTKPIITSKADFQKEYEKNKGIEKSKIIDFLKIDNDAAEIYSLGFASKKERLGASEMTHPLVFLNRE